MTAFTFIVVSIENPVISVYPDQTLHSAVSNLGLHWLPMSYLWDGRH